MILITMAGMAPGGGTGEAVVGEEGRIVGEGTMGMDLTEEVEVTMGPMEEVVMEEVGLVVVVMVVAGVVVVAEAEEEVADIVNRTRMFF